MTHSADEGGARSDKSGDRGDVPASKQELKIGLALSGGGMRAAVFHLGVLGRLAAEGVLENVEFVSTVSGGSLGTGLVYTVAGNRWPAKVARERRVSRHRPPQGPAPHNHRRHTARCPHRALA